MHPHFWPSPMLIALPFFIIFIAAFNVKDFFFTGFLSKLSEPSALCFSITRASQLYSLV